jgi:beta-aspartyl-peptidase (threonine type)
LGIYICDHHCVFCRDKSPARDSKFKIQNSNFFLKKNSKKKKHSQNSSPAAVVDPSACHDTVGCVCLDGEGNFAAVTTTGGIPMKRVGRVGDSPLVGCGFYADNELGAASSTGHGESIAKVVLCKGVLDRCDALSRAGSGTAAAAGPVTGEMAHAAAVDRLENMHRRLGSSGGVILIGRGGGVGVHFTTERMPWCVWREGAELRSGIDAPPGVIDI